MNVYIGTNRTLLCPKVFLKAIRARDDMFKSYYFNFRITGIFKTWKKEVGNIFKNSEFKIKRWLGILKDKNIFTLSFLINT